MLQSGPKTENAECARHNVDAIWTWLAHGLSRNISSFLNELFSSVGCRGDLRYLSSGVQNLKTRLLLNSNSLYTLEHNKSIIVFTIPYLKLFKERFPPVTDHIIFPNGSASFNSTFRPPLVGFVIYFTYGSREYSQVFST